MTERKVDNAFLKRGNTIVFTWPASTTYTIHSALSSSTLCFTAARSEVSYVNPPSDFCKVSGTLLPSTNITFRPSSSTRRPSMRNKLLCLELYLILTFSFKISQHLWHQWLVKRLAPFNNSDSQSIINLVKLYMSAQPHQLMQAST